MALFKLQHNVPVPPITRPRTKAKRRKYPFEDMAVGSFFFVPDKRAQQIRSYFSAVAQELGIKLTSRETHMRLEKGKWTPCSEADAGATLGIGVWRVD